MTLTVASLLRVLCGTSGLGITLTGCGGDPFRVEDQPLLGAGQAGTGSAVSALPHGAGALPVNEPQPTPPGDGAASDGVPSMGGNAGVRNETGAGAPAAGGKGVVLPTRRYWT